MDTADLDAAVLVLGCIGRHEKRLENMAAHRPAQHVHLLPLRAQRRKQPQEVPALEVQGELLLLLVVVVCGLDHARLADAAPVVDERGAVRGHRIDKRPPVLLDARQAHDQNERREPPLAEMFLAPDFIGECAPVRQKKAAPSSPSVPLLDRTRTRHQPLSAGPSPHAPVWRRVGALFWLTHGIRCVGWTRSRSMRLMVDERRVEPLTLTREVNWLRFPLSVVTEAGSNSRAKMPAARPCAPSPSFGLSGSLAGYAARPGRPRTLDRDPLLHWPGP